MNAEQIKQGLTSLEPTHPFYLALLALLDGDVEEETDGAVMPNLTDSARQFNAGRLAHARDIRRAVEGTVMKARQEIEAQELREQRRAEYGMRTI